METQVKEKIYYKDKQFCSFWKNCTKGNLCRNALTEHVLKEAYHFRLPVLRFKSIPEHCFDQK